MAATFATIEVWVLVDQFGEYAVGKSPIEAAECYGHENDALPTEGRRMVKIAVKVPLPKPVELAAEIAEESSELTAA